MKKCCISLIFISFILGCGTTAKKKTSDAVKTAELFTLVDGYFQSGEGGEPTHLTHEIKTRTVDIGDTLRLWIRFTSKESESHPCSRRSEKPCVATITFETAPDTGEGKRASIVLDDEFRTDGGEEGWSLATPEILTRQLPPGRGRVLFQITKEGAELFRVEIPIEIL